MLFQERGMQIQPIVSLFDYRYFCVAQQFSLIVY